MVIALVQTYKSFRTLLQTLQKNRGQATHYLQQAGALSNITCRIDSEQHKKEKNGNRNRKLVDFILITRRKGTITLNSTTPAFAQIQRAKEERAWGD